MQDQAEKIANYYADLQQKVFDKIIDMFSRYDISDLSPQETAEWTLRFLSETGYLTDYTVNLAAQTCNLAVSEVKKLIKQNGLQVAEDVGSKMSSLTGKEQPISSNVDQILESYSNQAIDRLNKNVNNTLLTRNTKNNAAAQAFQSIVNQTALEVQTGLKTPQRALRDNIYKWQDNGLKSALTDKNGHNWSLEGYARMLLNTAAGQTYNDISIQSMKDFGSHLAVMSSHPAARVACSYIQGQVVNLIPPEDPHYDKDYDSIYNHGYGTPSGTFGINCGHHLYPYVKGASHNYQKQYDPEEAQKKMAIQLKQRYYERQIRSLKLKLQDAEKLKDDAGQSRFRMQIRGYQAKLRQLVKSHDFLTRQYDREQIYNNRPHETFKPNLPKQPAPQPLKSAEQIKAEELATDKKPAKILNDVYLDNPMTVDQADHYSANPNFYGLTDAERQHNKALRSKAEELEQEYLKYTYYSGPGIVSYKPGITEEQERLAHKMIKKRNRLINELEAVIKKLKAYHINCQRCAPSYELRRRGYNVQALPNKPDYSFKEAYSIPANMWLNEDGTVSKPKMLKARSNSAVTKELMKIMQPGERGTIDWAWQRSFEGHIINIERTKTGLLFIDSQQGKITHTFEEYMESNKFGKTRYGRKIGVNYNRVDDKKFNLEALRLVVKKADGK